MLKAKHRFAGMQHWSEHKGGIPFLVVKLMAECTCHMLQIGANRGGKENSSNNNNKNKLSRREMKQNPKKLTFSIHTTVPKVVELLSSG